MNPSRVPYPFETTFRRALLRMELVLVSVAMILMVASISAQVVARFIFSTGLSWTDEIAVFSFVWLALVGAAIVVETRSTHMIDICVKRLPGAIRRGVTVAVYLLLLATMGFLLVYGLEIAEVVHGQRSSILNLRMSFVYGAMPFMGLLMLISLIFDWRSYLLLPMDKDESDG